MPPFHYKHRLGITVEYNAVNAESGALFAAVQTSFMSYDIRALLYIRYLKLRNTKFMPMHSQNPNLDQVCHHTLVLEEKRDRRGNMADIKQATAGWWERREEEG